MCSADSPLPRAAPLCFCGDGELLAVGRQDGCVHLLRSHDLRRVAVLSRHSGPVHALALSPDGGRLASGGGVVDPFPRPGEIKLWDPGEHRLLRTLHGHTDAVLTVAFSPDGRLLASGGRSQREPSLPGEVRLWPLSPGRPSPIPG